MGTGRPEGTLNRAGGWPTTEGRPDLPRIGEPRYVERASDVAGRRANRRVRSRLQVDTAGRAPLAVSRGIASCGLVAASHDDHSLRWMRYHCLHPGVSSQEGLP